MDALELVTTLKARGATLLPRGDRLRIQPGSIVTPELAEQVREHKAEILALLEHDTWPAECREAERRFGQRHARLFPLLERTVETPQGPGRLVQVFADRAAVELSVQPGRVHHFLPDEIRPSGSVARPWTFNRARTH